MGSIELGGLDQRGEAAACRFVNQARAITAFNDARSSAVSGIDQNGLDLIGLRLVLTRGLEEKRALDIAAWAVSALAGAIVSFDNCMISLPDLPSS